MEKIGWIDCFVLKKRAYVLGSLSSVEGLHRKPCMCAIISVLVCV